MRWRLFLTHTHSDHMRGLCAGWLFGKLYCSKVSANILLHRGLVRPSLVHARDVDQPFCIEDPSHPRLEITATFIDSNHCPGSIMVILEWPDGSAVLNTGDFRYEDWMLESSALRRIIQGQHCTQLYHDASWAHEAFSRLPLKCDSIGMLLRLIERHPFQRVVLHSHGLGDEEVLSAVC